ncbi:hypothetical protein Tco_0071042 [Tanacetum coccineum]
MVEGEDNCSTVVPMVQTVKNYECVSRSIGAIIRYNPKQGRTTSGEAFFKARINEARFEDERSTNTIAKPNDPNTGVHVEDLEETIRHKPNKVEAVKTSRVATFKEHEHQENQDNLNKIFEEKVDARSRDTFGRNGGDDSQNSGPETHAKEVVDNGNGSVLTFFVGCGSPRALKLWGKNGIEDVLRFLNSGGEHNFAQPNAGTESEVVSGLPKEFQEEDMVDTLSRVVKQKSLRN